MDHLERQCWTSVPDLVAARAAERPDAVAVEHGARRLSYGALLRRADAAASRLRTLGAGADVRIAVRCARSIESIVASLAVLRAGAAYVPIDPAYPIPRQEFILTDSGARAVLDGTDSDREDHSSGGEEAAHTTAAADHLAYVIYTSGSTGQPKGVAVEHASLANLVSWHRGAFRPTWTDRIGLGAGVGFDASVWELWANLAAGATLVVADEGVRRDPRRLRDFVVEAGITAMFVPTALASELITLSWPPATALRLLHTGGEALPTRPPANLPFSLVNHYGPAEATVITTSGPIAPGPGVPTIGRPIDGAILRVLDRAGAPVPAGTTGELHIGGAGLARGYLHRADLTDERFWVDSGTGERFYRTGDLVRQRADGELEYVGRLDDQVQVRGYRVEPGEVAAAIVEHPRISTAAVVAERDPSGATQLAAFYAAADDIDDLRDWLAARVPAYLVPVRLVRRDALPVTANGKVDREALLAASGAASRDVAHPPGTAAEMAVAQVWAEVFGFPVGVDEPFDKLGGHSLHAVRVANRLRERHGMIAPLEIFFGPVTVAELATLLESESDRSKPTSLPRSVDAGMDAPLTAAQQRYWFLNQFVPDPALYNVAAVFAIDGELDVTALRAAIDDVLCRHDALRLAIVETPAGLRQRVQPVTGVAMAEHDLRAAPGQLSEVFAAAARHEFDLRRAPLLRAELARIADDSWRLCLIAHHIAMDGASIEPLMREIGRTYAARWTGQADPSAVGEPASFTDVARWEAEYLGGERLAGLLEHWNLALRDAPTLLELPTDRPRPASPSHVGATTARHLPSALLTAMDATAQRTGSSQFMVLLAGLATLLHRHTGQTDMIIGTPVANRARSEFDEMIGCFVNTLPMRCDVGGEPTFADLLARVRRVALDAYAHEALPFDRMLDVLGGARPRAHHPLFTVMLVVQSGVGDVRLPAAQLRYAGELHSGTAQFDLTFVLEQVDATPVLSLEYATDLFDRATADRLLHQLERVLTQVVHDPDVPVHAVALLDREEREQILGWGTGPVPGADIEWPAYRVVEERCAAQPDALAVTCGDARLRYGELNMAANQLARRLLEAGVRAGTPVGVLLDRGVHSVVAMLAIGKSGGVYLPLDPAYPDERLRAMLADARPPVVICTDQERLAGLGDAQPVAPAQPDQPAADLAGTPGGDDPAYLIFTSGSTGQPKGVLATHRGLANIVAAKRDGFDVRPDSRVLQFVSFGFGVSITDVYMTLCAGATLVVRDAQTLAGAELVALIERNQITNLVLPASVLAAMPDAILPTVRSIAVGGEACSAALVDRWGADRRFVNSYGPTEAAVASAMAVCRPGDGPPPVGRPIPGARVYVLDRHRELQPVGVAGEVYLAGAGLALGYLNQPELTAERFLPDPFGPGRMYRTGDLARWRADGQLMLLGRDDEQVNLRGVRIELGEVEAALRGHPAVAEAVAAVQTHPVAGERLVAYLVEADAAPSPAELRRYLHERLPEHFVPGAFRTLPHLPRTGTGKLDRRALPPVGLETDHSGSRPPAGITEEVLAEIWGAVLVNAGTIGAEDDFFAIGGQSILAASVMAQVRERFEVDLPVRTLFESSTIAALARSVEQAILAELTGSTR